MIIMENKEFEQKSQLLNFLEKRLMVLIWIVILILISFLVFDNIGKSNPQESDLKPILDTIIIYKQQHQEATQNTQIMELNKEKLLLSIMWVESNYNPEAIGDNGSSFGLFQVKQIFYRHHTGKDDFEAYKFDEFRQIDLHLDLLEKYKDLTILEFARKVQKPKYPDNWSDKVVLKYNLF